MLGLRVPQHDARSACAKLYDISSLPGTDIQFR